MTLNKQEKLPYQISNALIQWLSHYIKTHKFQSCKKAECVSSESKTSLEFKLKITSLNLYIEFYN